MAVPLFWIPKYKYQLVDILSSRYPKDREKFRKMKKKQLLAILLDIRRRDGNNFC